MAASMSGMTAAMASCKPRPITCAACSSLGTGRQVARGRLDAAHDGGRAVHQSAIPIEYDQVKLLSCHVFRQLVAAGSFRGECEAASAGRLQRLSQAYQETLAFSG